MPANNAFIQGLNQASEEHGFEGDGFAYLRSPLWWAGIVTSMDRHSFSVG